MCRPHNLERYFLQAPPCSWAPVRGEIERSSEAPSGINATVATRALVAGITTSSNQGVPAPCCCAAPKHAVLAPLGYHLGPECPVPTPSVGGYVQLLSQVRELHHLGWAASDCDTAPWSSQDHPTAMRAGQALC